MEQQQQTPSSEIKVSNFKDHNNSVERVKIKESPTTEQLKQSPDENNYNASPTLDSNNTTTMPVPGSVGVQGQNATQGMLRN